MTGEFLEEARRDLEEAASWYQSRSPGLGHRFAREVARVLAHIAANPLLWRERPGGWRRVNCPVFPYYVAYFIRGEILYIAAVAHGRRRPGYWSSRMSP